MPYDAVRKFESEVATWAGALYGVAVESCSAAIFLSCLYYDIRGKSIHIPKHTYPSVPAAIIHAGGNVVFEDQDWDGIYQLAPYPIYDSALCFRRGMYTQGLHCLSFHAKKLLPIGRGGMILTDDVEAVIWLRLARFDGREEIDLNFQLDYQVLGWNMYMTPEQASRGLQLFNLLKHRDVPNLRVEEQQYPDLSKYEIFRS